MNIELTASAAEEVRRILREQQLEGQGLGLRVGVKGYGPQRRFTLELSEPDGEQEVRAESQGLRILFRETDRPQLEGVTIDVHNMGGSLGFIFKLPKHDLSVQSGEGDPNQPPPDEQQVRAALREVIDPEVGVNIVDLGLVYGLTIEGSGVHVVMTMTTPACPLSEHIKSEVNARVRERCPAVDRIEVEIVWEPPWSTEKITSEGKQMLGWSR